MMVVPFTVLNRALKPFGNLLAGWPVLTTFQVSLRCNSACGYCDLPLNVGRYELTRKEIRGVFSCLYRDGVRFVLVQGGEPLLRRDLPEILEDLSAIGCSATRITAGLLEGIGWIGAAARIAVGGTIAGDVLTVVVAAMAGATTDSHILLFHFLKNPVQYGCCL